MEVSVLIAFPSFLLFLTFVRAQYLSLSFRLDNLAVFLAESEMQITTKSLTLSVCPDEQDRVSAEFIDSYSLRAQDFVLRGQSDQ